MKNPPTVLVADTGVDAIAVLDAEGGPMLVLRPDQSSGSANAAVRRAMPGLHPDVIRQLVQDHLPAAPELDLTRGLPTTRSSALDEEPESALRLWLRTPGRRKAVAMGVVAVAGVGLLSVALQVGRAEAQPHPVLELLEVDGMRCADGSQGVIPCTDPVMGAVVVETMIGAGSTMYVFQSAGGWFLVREYIDGPAAAAAVGAAAVDHDPSAGSWFGALHDRWLVVHSDQAGADEVAARLSRNAS